MTSCDFDNFDSNPTTADSLGCCGVELSSKNLWWRGNWWRLDRRLFRMPLP